MTNTELAKLVKDMRLAQQNYFRTRTPETLDRSKNLEKLVDQAVAEILHPFTQSTLNF